MAARLDPKQGSPLKNPLCLQSASRNLAFPQRRNGRETPVRAIIRMPGPVSGRADEASPEDPPQVGIYGKNWARASRRNPLTD